MSSTARSSPRVTASAFGLGHRGDPGPHGPDWAGAEHASLTGTASGDRECGSKQRRHLGSQHPTRNRRQRPKRPRAPAAAYDHTSADPDMGTGSSEALEGLAHRVTEWTGGSWAFGVALATIVVWG
mgnify:CR=1 FL=1